MTGTQRPGGNDPLLPEHFVQQGNRAGVADLLRGLQRCSHLVAGVDARA
ncbi:hypothetical protein EDF62_2980 [Leucobacter luti]|uniref:Uncharacterized protein n=1 Tax=Leucobacter luti TaxID=340320 RepID=A0A4V3CXI3_9MICO|nr:hypothetical protein EDF62_2980 [Leucobacter luti]